MSVKAIAIVVSLVLLAASEWLMGNLGVDVVGVRHALLLFTAMSLAIIFTSSPILPTGFYLGIAAVVIVGFVSSIGQATPWLNRTIGALFTMFPFLVFVLATRVKVAENTVFDILRGISAFCLLAGAYPVVLHIPDLPEAMRWQFGIFREVGAFASIMNIGVAASLAISFAKRDAFFFWLAVLLSLFVMMTVLKKTMISNFLVWTVFMLINGVSRKSISFLFLLPPTIVVFWGAIRENIGENLDYLANVGVEGHVRLAMYIGSLQIATDNFPFGSGFGSFGSLASIFNWYSPLYAAYGVDLVGANSEADVLAGHHTLLDTFWPHIIAELGVIGLIAYILVCARPIADCFKVSRFKETTMPVRQAAIFVVAVNSSILWEGVTLYNPETPVFVAFTCLVGGLFYRFCVDGKSNSSGRGAKFVHRNSIKRG